MLVLSFCTRNLDTRSQVLQGQPLTQSFLFLGLLCNSSLSKLDNENRPPTMSANFSGINLCPAPFYDASLFGDDGGCKSTYLSYLT